MLKVYSVVSVLSFFIFSQCIAASSVLLEERVESSVQIVDKYLKKLTLLSQIKYKDKFSILKDYFTDDRFSNSLTPELAQEKINEAAAFLGYGDDYLHFLDYVYVASTHSLNILIVIDKLREIIKDLGVLRKLQQSPGKMHELLCLCASSKNPESAILEFIESSL